MLAVHVSCANVVHHYGVFFKFKVELVKLLEVVGVVSSDKSVSSRYFDGSLSKGI